MKFHPRCKRMALAVALGLLLGLGARKVLLSSGGSAATFLFPATGNSGPAGTAQEGSPASAGAGSTMHHTLAALKSLGGYGRYAPAGITKNIGRMSTPDLKDLLARLDTSSIGVSTESGGSLRKILIHTAIAELYRREGENSLRWAHALGNPADGSRSAVFDDLLGEAIFNDPGLACQWIADCSDERGPGWTTGQFTRAYHQASAISTDAVLEVERQIKHADLNLTTSPMPLTFAEGFDFPRFVAETQSRTYLNLAASFWAAKDPEAAFAGMKERLETTPYLLPYLSQGVSTSQGETAAAAWTVGKLMELPEENREKMVMAIAGTSLPYSPASLQTRTVAYMNALAGDPEQWIFAAHTFFAWTYWNQSNPDLTGLKMLGSEELEARALAERAKYTTRLGADREGQEWQGYETAMDQLGFSEDSREKVRANFHGGQL